ncbi:hypothetical protein CPBF424_18760 [Xanthomonas euroxanthea]|uniref:Uncharacterized protein n=1 Tax=Xanthomonas euroxanthea TaxID=2259622 RepID=A0AA46C7U9_9XANT|nr:hypothetical protein CPBF424_18760 [Xanthomonas euroxanthea]
MTKLNTPCGKALDRTTGMVTKGLSMHAKSDLFAVSPLARHLTNNDRSI